MDLFKNLNENQVKAVKAVSGPVMVVAGAGSGKTRVLTHRLAYLVSQGVDSSNILAVTFTNKAAKEMKERVEAMLNDENHSTICTFHSLCARILRSEADALGYKRSFEIFDEDESIKALKKVFEDLHFDKTQYKEKNFKNLISLVKNGKSLPMMDERMKHDFELCYEKYNERLKMIENAMDFDDLLLNTVYLFNIRPDILEAYQRRFIYIMVDEYQDTNDIQYDLISLLASKYRNIFVVGDGDQSIYSFRNANVGNIKKFMDDFKAMQIILDINYRSTQYILSAANSLINRNHDRIKKNLKAFKDDGYKPKLKECITMNDELIYIKNKIMSLHDRGYAYSDMAVFYRANSLSRNIEDILMKNSIPYRIYGGLSFFSRKEVKDILAYLKLVIDRENVWAFKRVVNEPKRGIGTSTIDKIDDLLTLGLSLNEAIIKVNNKKVNDFLKLIDFIEDTLKVVPMVEYVDVLVKTLGYEQIYLDEPDRLDNIKELKSVLQEASDTYEGEDFEKLKEMLDYLSLRTDKEENNILNDTVSLMTYHQAKGLEYKVVFMMAMEEGIFPSSMITFGSEAELEEERRIAYVGITRAMERLYLSYAKNRIMYGEQRYSRVSRFVTEINREFIENENEAKRIIFEPNTNFKNEFKKETKIESKPKTVSITEIECNETYEIGDKVNHKVFGDGVIVGMDDTKLTIAFKAEFGIKKLAKGHPTLSKI